MNIETKTKISSDDVTSQGSVKVGRFSCSRHYPAAATYEPPPQHVYISHGFQLICLLCLYQSYDYNLVESHAKNVTATNSVPVELKKMSVGDLFERIRYRRRKSPYHVHLLRAQKVPRRRLRKKYLTK